MKIEVVNSLRGPLTFIIDEITVGVNLNYLVKKSTTKEHIVRILGKDLENITNVNLCNFSSLCNKMMYKYGSDESIDLLKMIVSAIRTINPNINFVQYNIQNHLETDILPAIQLIQVDEENQMLYMHKALKNIFKLLGYTDSQIPRALSLQGFLDALPYDLFEYIPRDNSKYEEEIKKVQACLMDISPITN